ncbi:hypothetical protein FQA39_LY02581 [Lamprigera yunnana]|nr:hypothetical protein FQA39_LY02581 [Lamprigera yunnana]
MGNLQRRDENVISSPLPIEICQTTDAIHLQIMTLEDTTVVVEPSGSGENSNSYSPAMLRQVGILVTVFIIETLFGYNESVPKKLLKINRGQN